MNVKDLTKIQIDGIDMDDYPKFCGARISAAEFNGKALTDEELESLHENDPEGVCEAVADEVIHQSVLSFDRIKERDNLERSD